MFSYCYSIFNFSTYYTCYIYIYTCSCTVGGGGGGGGGIFGQRSFPDMRKHICVDHKSESLQPSPDGLCAHVVWWQPGTLDPIQEEFTHSCTNGITGASLGQEDSSCKQCEKWKFCSIQGGECVQQLWVSSCCLISIFFAELSFRGAVQVYGIRKSTLHDHHSGKVKATKCGPETVLSACEELC